MFVDEARIILRSGKGGDGVVHFHREKYINRGGPDGGDGGRGGDVIMKVDPCLNTLLAFRHKSEFIAEDGKRGGVNNQKGKSAEPLVILVPPGTMVYDADTDDLLGDLTQPQVELIVCSGGRGGRGNARFATSTHQAPRIAEKGEPGTKKNLHLELKLIAEVGIVGMPNAGKSSLLAAVTNAKPKIADYPFTTVFPNLGVAQLDDDHTLVLADIPGLIEGAHSGVGLGDAFLRHIQRTHVLIHIIDGLSAQPFADYSQINSELALFDPHLIEKIQVVALSKYDLSEVRERWSWIKTDFEKHKINIIPISSITHENLNELLWKTYEKLQVAPRPEVSLALPIYRPGANIPEFEIKFENDGWRVCGKAIERAVLMTYWEYDESVRRFQRIMEALGVDESLRKAGVKEGDTVRIGDHELIWQD